MEKIHLIKNKFTDVNFNMNIYLHSLILFTFLSIFFIFYITKLSKKAFDTEMTELIHKLSTEQIKNNPFIQNLIASEQYDKIINMYMQPHVKTEISNSGLFNIVFAINLL